MTRNSSQSVCLGWFVCGCCWLVFHESTLIVGNSEELQQSIEVTEWIIQRRIVVLCKTFEVVTWKVDLCCVHVFMFCQVERFMSETLNYVICLDQRIYVIGTWVPMEVKCDYGFVWFEDFEKKKESQWAQEREIRVIWPLRNPQASLSWRRQCIKWLLDRT